MTSKLQLDRTTFDNFSQQLEFYESTYNVRRVVLATSPSSTDGTSATGTGTGATEDLTFNATFADLAGLATTATVDMSGLWHYPATIVDSANTFAIAYFGTGPSNTVAGVMSQLPNGRQFMSFYLNFATCLPTASYYNSSEVFRVRPEDVAAIYSWQDDLNSRLPAGSNFKLEFAFNGKGILANISSPLRLTVTPSSTVSNTYVKPLGSGTNAWPSSFSTEWTNLTNGLFNGDALAVFTANGMTTAVGDNSRSSLVPSNAYHEWISTTASSNFDGFHVIPRQPTEIYFTADTANQNVAIYNSMYSSQPVVTAGNTTGRLPLLQQWVEVVVAKYLALVKWPLQSYKMDDLALLYRDHEARDTCGIATSFHIASGVLTSVTITTTNSCKVGVTLPQGTAPGESSTVEKVGNDPMTVWVDMPAGASKTISIAGLFSWV
ncbi:hypothetical protein M427DRAFT_149533 [Gonapodya prolifera JEL478]|uniref:Uncharacterized protein n=1 Tax=Gonapodya prolifera (strain JEL478) TaxID=1344416 RepID=A0A138ZZ64_GONPJ|nr:hypothetical protein M427DRAFT_149533 [Gonapodya prolifera JEL478]|eukprot:KXS09708.1 hypothetical protein M427DRAFT_149533 [Gonapodya prolifera JEL478]